MLTLCVFPIYHSTTLPTVIHNACREGWSDIGWSESTKIQTLEIYQLYCTYAPFFLQCQRPTHRGGRPPLSRPPGLRWETHPRPAAVYVHPMYMYIRTYIHTMYIHNYVMTILNSWPLIPLPPPPPPFPYKMNAWRNFNWKTWPLPRLQVCEAQAVNTIRVLSTGGGGGRKAFPPPLQKA